METCYEEVERGEIKNLQKYQKNIKQEIRKSSISETSHKLEFQTLNIPIYITYPGIKIAAAPKL